MIEPIECRTFIEVEVAFFTFAISLFQLDRSLLKCVHVCFFS